MKIYTEENLYNKIDKILNKSMKLEKKKKLWGINEEEEIQLFKLKLEYLQYYSMLIDMVFINYVEPMIYDEEIMDIKSEIMMKSNWEGNVLMTEDEIDNFINKIKDKEDMINLIQKLKIKEIKNMKKTEINGLGEEIFKLFNELPGIGEDEDYKNNIIDYIIIKYDIMISILEGDDI